MATTRKYDNGPSGWNDYDEKGNVVASGTYNAPGTERNPFNADPSSGGGGTNSGEGSLWSNATGQKVGSSGSSGSGSSKSSSYDYDYSSTASAIRKAQEEALASMKDAYDDQLDATVNTYNTERAKIPGQVATANNQASSNGMINAQKIRNSLAQMGLLQSGESASQQLSNDISVANNINDNNLQGRELDASYADKIAAAIADNAVNYNNAVYQLGQDAIRNNLSSAQLAAQISQFNQNLAHQKEQDAFNNGIAEGNLTGYYNGTYYKNGVAQDSSSVILPSSVSSLYPNATNVTKTGSGYSFYVNGVKHYYAD